MAAFFVQIFFTILEEKINLNVIKKECKIKDFCVMALPALKNNKLKFNI